MTSRASQGRRKTRTPQPHEITCCYAGGPGEPYYQPQMDCSCGFSTGRCANWSDAGYEMDAHIETQRDAEEVQRGKA